VVLQTVNAVQFCARQSILDYSEVVSKILMYSHSNYTHTVTQFQNGHGLQQSLISLHTHKTPTKTPASNLHYQYQVVVKWVLFFLIDSHCACVIVE
jgi:hypothetical protein